MTTLADLRALLRSVASNVAVDPDGRSMGWMCFSRDLTDEEAAMIDGTRVPDHPNEMFVYQEPK